MSGFYPGDNVFPSNSLLPGQDNSEPEPQPTGKIARWLNSRFLPNKKHRFSGGYDSRYTPTP